MRWDSSRRSWTLISSLIFILHSYLVSSLGFDGIPGDYCAIRTPEKCCTSRNDECTMPILGNHLCYCDMFCREHPGNDCCPDFKFVCENGGGGNGDGGRTTPPPFEKPDDGSGTGECIDNDGKSHSPGETYTYNCNQCVCGGPKECDGKACVIQTDLLDQINSGSYSWKASNYSDFWGKALEDGVKYRLGTLFPDKTVSTMNEILIDIEPNLPEHFNAKEKWPQYIHPVRDQKNCGSSWAFSTTAVSADRLAIQSEGKFNAVLSPQQLISCNQFKQKGCDGGYLDRAWWYIRKLGVVSEECYPYTSGTTNQGGQCSIPTSQYKRGETISCPSGDRDNRIFKMTPPYRISTKEEEIQTEIFINGPVQATFEVSEDFFMYKSGVYKHTDLARNKGSKYRTTGSYHSVRVLGWGVDRSSGTPVKYWLCDNSWGTEWGEDGLFRIIRGENHNEIESFVLGAWGKGSKRRKRFLVRKVKRLRKF